MTLARASAAGLVALVLVLGARRAAAEPRPPTRGGDDQARFRALTAEGRKRYDIKDYDRAIEAFKAAYLVHDAPELLFDIAQAYRLKGDCAQARTFYGNFIRRAETGPLRTRAEEELARLPTCVAPSAAPNPAPASRSRPVNESRTGRRDRAPWLGLAIGGVGLGLAIGGTYLVVDADRTFDELKDRCGNACPRSSWAGLDTRERVGWALVAGGATAMGAAVFLLVRGAKEDGPAVAARRLRLSPWSVALAGEF